MKDLFVGYDLLLTTENIAAWMALSADSNMWPVYQVR